MTDDLELVQFITAEIGDDLIVSFFVAKPDYPIDGRSGQSQLFCQCDLSERPIVKELSNSFGGRSVE